MNVYLEKKGRGPLQAPYAPPSFNMCGIIVSERKSRVSCIKTDSSIEERTDSREED
jgi:hypothetical protein